jgi:hypothetical protein
MECRILVRSFVQLDGGGFKMCDAGDIVNVTTPDGRMEPVNPVEEETVEVAVKIDKRFKAKG